MSGVHRLSREVAETADILGGKGHGLVALRRLGLPVPPGFVIDTRVCRAFLRDGRLPESLDADLADAVRALETATRRRFGAAERPLVVSVRSGAAVSMPGMMSTVLNLGLTTAAATGLQAETGDPSFVLDSRLRLLSSFAATVFGVAADDTEAAVRHVEPVRSLESLIRERSGTAVPDDAMVQLRMAVQAVFSSWNSPRAITYRDLHGIGHDLGTAVVVQAMVFGNRDHRSGSGIAFSRDPSTGTKTPFGEVLFGRQGEDVVSGRAVTRPLSELAEREPTVWSGLIVALERIEQHYRDVCHLEFTFESGRLWFLQVRSGGLAGRAAIRAAVDLADGQIISRRTALRRISSQDLRNARTPRIRVDDVLDVLTRGRGASPGVATGRIAVTADHAVRMVTDGPVILMRPYTSPLDMHGLAAASGVVTVRGGPASHAAVVARSMGKPAVVEAAGVTVDASTGCVRAGDRVVPEGTLITIDGMGGEVVLGEPDTTTGTTDPHLRRLLDWADEISGDSSLRTEEERLAAARNFIALPPDTIRAFLFDSVGTLIEHVDQPAHRPDTQPRVRVFSEVPALLQQLHERGLPIAVVTDSLGTAESERRDYDRLGIGGYFRFFAVAGDLGCTKPDAKMYRMASEALGVPPRQTCYVDDHPGMVAAAIKLGYRGLVLHRAESPRRSDLPWISSLHELDILPETPRG